MHALALSCQIALSCLLWDFLHAPDKRLLCFGIVRSALLEFGPAQHAWSANVAQQKRFERTMSRMWMR